MNEEELAFALEEEASTGLVSNELSYDVARHIQTNGIDADLDRVLQGVRKLETPEKG